jgi:hypothetical protein
MNDRLRYAFEQATEATMESRVGFESSLLKSFMRRQSAGRTVPLGGIALGGKVEGMFVENEILVNARNTAALDFLADRCGGEVMPARPLPEPPRSLRGAQRRDIDPERLPQTLTVKIRGDDVALDPVLKLARHADARTMQLSSNAAAGTLAASLLLRERNLGGGLNVAGVQTAFPLLSAAESAAAGNPYTWAQYTGKSQVTRAWQLCQALDNVRSMRAPIFIAILDMGFDNSANVDFPIFQFNLTNEGASALGAAPAPNYAWHGIAVAGVAAAAVNNMQGAAGVAGIPVGAANQPVARPFLFRTNIVISEIYRCLNCCVWWGIDVLNMSFRKTWPKILLPLDGDWEDNFQFAHDQGLIMVTGAGNDGKELPDFVTFPATRTPGVITVGALDTNADPNLNYNVPRGDSNYGSSVDVWAPGTNLQTVPTPGGGTFSTFNQTSAAAPFVAGIAALMKSANPSLRPPDIKHILRETAWTNSPNSRSNRIVNAYQAVLRGINHALPPGIFEEPNDNPATAKPMVQPAPNTFRPSGETVVSNGYDWDYHRFTTSEYADIVATLTFVQPLSSVVMELIPESDIVALGSLTDNRAPGSQTISLLQAPPGNYLLKVRSAMPNYYRLNVATTPRPLTPDIFENNNTKERAARIHLRNFGVGDALGIHFFYQGAYEANIQSPADVDWYHIVDIHALVLTYPVCQILNSDAPLEVRLYMPDGSLANTWLNVRSMNVRLPEPECWVEIRAPKATRYSVHFGYMLNKSALPNPNQEPDIHVIPDWWPDPPFVLKDWEKWFEVVIDENLRQHGVLQLDSDKPLQWDLLAPDLTVLRSGVKANGSAETVNVRDLVPGKYLLRIGRQGHAAARFAPSQRGDVKFSVGPGF